MNGEKTEMEEKWAAKFKSFVEWIDRSHKSLSKKNFVDFLN